MIRKFAIAGKAGSGKDAFAEILTKEFLLQKNGHIFNIAFADSVKEMAQIICSELKSEEGINWLWGPSELRKTIIPSLGISVRELLLKIGKFGRSIHRELWINCTLNQVLEFDQSFSSTSTNRVVIIKDLRMFNEFHRLREEGYFIINIIRNDREENPFEQDESETELDTMTNYFSFDYVINNNNSLEELKKEAKLLISKLS